jgi:hypothetical protein
MKLYIWLNVICLSGADRIAWTINWAYENGGLVPFLELGLSCSCWLLSFPLDEIRWMVVELEF